MGHGAGMSLQEPNTKTRKKRSRWGRVGKVAERWHGCLHVDAGVRAGISRAALYRQVPDRGWDKPYPRVFVLPGAPDTEARRIAAAMLAVGGADPKVWADRWTALWLHGLLRNPPTTIHLAVPDGQSYPTLKRVKVRRSSTLVDEHTTEVLRLPTLNPARALVDMGAVAAKAYLRGLIIDARQRGLASLAQLDEVLEGLPNVRGRKLLAQLVWELDEERCDSVLEALVREVLRAAGVAAPHPEPYRIETPHRTLELDIAWPALRCGIEVDGMGFHSARDHLDTDQRRHNALVLAGWRVLRVGWYRVEDPKEREGFLREVGELLAGARGRGPRA